MAAQQRRVEVISHNLANVNTTGFKRSRAHFEDLLYQTLEAPGAIEGSDAESSPSMQIGRGTRLSSVQRVELQGPIEQTGRPLDLAIEGDGFFQVELPGGGLAYTRDGSFNISDQGVLVTAGGYTVAPGVQIPSDLVELSVSRTGVITGLMPGESTPVEIGRLELARFANAPALRALGENLFQETPASGQAQTGNPQDPGFGRVFQGGLEGSNVEIVQEMVDMITAMRAYEINSKAVQSAEAMAETASQLLR
jgi:flagellar basal-body rod protein FlgG